jgi:hypothetical protein
VVGAFSEGRGRRPSAFGAAGTRHSEAERDQAVNEEFMIENQLLYRKIFCGCSMHMYVGEHFMYVHICTYPIDIVVSTYMNVGEQ